MDAESYLLLLLADSNLPTGSFVASAGLESYIKHGFASVTSFVQESLASYAKSSLPFVSDTRLAIGASSIGEFIDDKDIQTRVDDVLKDIRALDELYETMTLNHVARRASKTQGVALLTLYSRSFAPPEPTTEQKVYTRLLDRFKLLVRRGDTFGHLPICWGLLAGALGLHIERTLYLYLFLYARSLTSAAVRLNTIGPYHSQHLLLHTIKPFIDEQAKECSLLRTGLVLAFGPTGKVKFDLLADGPANTWPLGEILAARHDLQHSRIFNS